jgi:glutathione S-transferase
MHLNYQTIRLCAQGSGVRARSRPCRSPARATSPTNRNDSVFAVDPLGKVPVLVLPDGEAIFDSKAICDHLETLTTIQLIPEHGSARRAALRL